MYISKRMIVVGILIALSLIVTTWVFAQGDDLIYACINPAGTIRIVDDSESCYPKETLLEWNKQGVKGDPGVIGPAGPPGPAGVLDFYVVEGEEVNCAPANLCYLDAYCNEGDYVVGGGINKNYWFQYDDPGIGIIAMFPYQDPATEVWEYFAAINNRHDFDSGFSVYAICAEMP